MALALGEIEIARLRGDVDLADRLLLSLGRGMGESLAAADLLGRRRVMLELRAQGLLRSKEVALFAATPKVPFLEAIGNLTGRKTVLTKTAEEVRAAWAGNGFALARSASERVTAQVRGTITRFLRQRVVTSVEGAIGSITKALRSQEPGGPGGFTRAYAETVFRTSSATAYQKGREAQAARPEVIEVASGWRYDATNDPDVRENHLAGDGFVAHTQDAIWETHAPPNGFNCRCVTVFVTTEEMRKLGLSDARGNSTGGADSVQRALSIGFRPDLGFKLGG